MSLTSAMQIAKKFATDNSPAILTSLGVAGVVTTMVLTGKATLHADRILQGEYYIQDEFGKVVETDVELTKMDIAKLVWREFIPPVLVGTATIVCILGANHVGARRAAAIAAAFKITEEAAAEYRTKVVEQIGKKAEDEIRSKVAGDRMERTPGRETIIIVGSESVFFDEFSGRYFKAEYEKVRKAINDINFQVNTSFYASLSDFYDMLGLEPTSMSNEVGWNADQQMEVDFAAVLMSDNKPAISMHYRTTPIRGYDRIQ